LRRPEVCGYDAPGENHLDSEAGDLRRHLRLRVPRRAERVTLVYALPETGSRCCACQGSSCIAPSAARANSASGTLAVLLAASVRWRRRLGVRPSCALAERRTRGRAAPAAAVSRGARVCQLTRRYRIERA